MKTRVRIVSGNLHSRGVYKLFTSLVLRLYGSKYVGEDSVYSDTIKLIK